MKRVTKSCKCVTTPQKAAALVHAVAASATMDPIPAKPDAAADHGAMKATAVTFGDVASKAEAVTIPPAAATPSTTVEPGTNMPPEATSGNGTLPPNAENLMSLTTVEPTKLEMVRIGSDEVAVVPFTTAAVPLRVHYVEDPEMRGYVRCPSAGCILCRVGRKAEERKAIPVYVPAERRIGVLLVSALMRPAGLLYQYLEHVRATAGVRVVLLVRREDNTKFITSASPIPPGVDDGASMIAKFVADWQAGKVDPAAVVPAISIEHAKQLPSVANMLKIKGIE